MNLEPFNPVVYHYRNYPGDLLATMSGMIIGIIQKLLLIGGVVLLFTHHYVTGALVLALSWFVYQYQDIWTDAIHNRDIGSSANQFRDGTIIRNTATTSTSPSSASTILPPLPPSAPTADESTNESAIPERPTESPDTPSGNTSQSAVKFCTHCGAKNPSAANFCGSCGKPF